MSQLPFDEKLNIGYLSRLFDDTSNCYSADALIEKCGYPQKNHE